MTEKFELKIVKKNLNNFWNFLENNVDYQVIIIIYKQYPTGCPW